MCVRDAGKGRRPGMGRAGMRRGTGAYSEGLGQGAKPKVRGTQPGAPTRAREPKRGGATVRRGCIYCRPPPIFMGGHASAGESGGVSQTGHSVGPDRAREGHGEA